MFRRIRMFNRVTSLSVIVSVIATMQFTHVTVIHASPYDIDVISSMSQQEPTEGRVGHDASSDADQIPMTSWVAMGAVAPFSGVLLNSVAMADITTRLDQADARCKREVDHQVDVTRTLMQRDIDIVTARVVAAEDKLDLERRIADEKIDLLHTELKLTTEKVPKRNWGPLWFAGGVVSGVLVILAGAYAVKGVNSTH